MRNYDGGSRAKEWARLAVKVGLLLTEPRVRRGIRDQFSDRADSVSDKLTRKYEDAVDRLEAASNALRGRSQWPSHTVAVLMGIAVGAGIGILLAPASGEET